MSSANQYTMSGVTTPARKSRIRGVTPMPLYPGERTEIEETIMMVYALCQVYSQIDLAHRLDAGNSTNIYRWLKARNRPTNRAMRKNIQQEYYLHYGDKPVENVIPADIVKRIRNREPVDAPKPEQL